MHWKLAFPSDYISSADLRGRDVSLTISGANLDNVKVIDGKGKGEDQKKLVLEFEELKDRGKGTPRKLVVNKTNAKTIARLHGNEVNSWIGKRITLYPTTCLAFGKTEDCVRIRDQAPPPQQPAKQPEPATDPMPGTDNEHDSSPLADDAT